MSYETRLGDAARLPAWEFGARQGTGYHDLASDSLHPG